MWDGLAAAALLAPLAGLAALVAGAAGRHAVVRAGRWGALAALAGWVLLLAAGAAPELGRFAPDRLALAGAAAAVLLAAVVASDPPGEERPALSAVVAPLVATAVALVAGILGAPDDLSDGRSLGFVLVGASLGTTALWFGGQRARWSISPLALVGLAPALLLLLRGASDGPDDPVAIGGLVAAGAAAASAVREARWPRRYGHPADAVVFLVAAVALAPVPAVRPWSFLVAAGAVLVATGAGRWSVAGLAPAVAGVAAAVADVPAPGGDGAAVQVAWAAAVAGVVVLLVAGLAGPDEPAPATETRAATAVLAGWLVVAPGSWRWAVRDAEALAGWDRAMAVTVVAALTMATVRGLLGARDRATTGTSH